MKADKTDLDTKSNKTDLDLKASNIDLSNGLALKANLISPSFTKPALWTPSGGNVTHTVGESLGGGIVFYITTNGLHRLIAATQDQCTTSSWLNAQDEISNVANHNTAGKLYTDWRLPTRN